MLSAVLTSFAMLSGYLGILSIPCRAQQNPLILVRVVDHQGALVPSPEAHIVGKPGRIGFLTGNGTIAFKGVPPGTYQILVTCRGFKDERVSDVVVAESKTTELHTTLTQMHKPWMHKPQ